MRDFIQEKPINSKAFFANFSSVLIKAEEVNDKWIVYLKASNENLDLEEERVLQKALKAAAPMYLRKGVISWDHLHKLQKDPKFIVGEPIDVAFGDDKSTLVKGVLYKENSRAQGIWQDIMSNSTRFGSSVGGYILGKSSPSDVNKVYWDDTAITNKPVNDSLLGAVSTIPFKEFAKALMAGSGVDAASFTGGRATIPEDMQGVVVDEVQRPDEKISGISPSDLTLLFEDVISAIRSGLIMSPVDLVSFVAEKGYTGSVAAQIIQFIMQKLYTTRR